MWRNRSIPMRKFLLCAWAGLLTFAGAGRADDLSDLKGRLEADYYGYKVTDTRNHFTNFDTGRNTVGDESALLIKRGRFWFDGTLFDPDLHFNLTFDGNTRGVNGFDTRQNSFANPIGNI